MATTTTPPLMVVCSGASSITTAVMLPPQGPKAALVQQDVFLPPPLMPRDTRGVVGLTTVPQQLLQSLMPFQAYANYAMVPLQVHFSFRVKPPTYLSRYLGVYTRNTFNGCFFHCFNRGSFVLFSCHPGTPAM